MFLFATLTGFRLAVEWLLSGFFASAAIDLMTEAAVLATCHHYVKQSTSFHRLILASIAPQSS